MLDYALLEEVIADNRKFAKKVQLFQRDVVMQEFPACVVVGLRRCGKSYWLFQVMQNLVKSGVDWSQILYVNFESERLFGFDYRDFNRLLEANSALTGNPQRPILFLDEVQIVPGWEKFARRMADEKTRTYITGSNAKMLSSDVASALGGRYLLTRMMTLSFPEFLRAKGIPFDRGAVATTEDRGIIRNAFQRYLFFGGFPEVVKASKEMQLNCVDNVFQAIYLRDIIERCGVTNHKALQMMLRKLAESLGQPISFSRLTNILKETENKLSKVSVISYIGACEDACLLHTIPNIHGKILERETRPKYYFADNGLINLLRRDPEAALLENLVALSLLRRYKAKDAVYYYAHNVEVDFYVPEDELAIQVAVTLQHSPETLKREVGALEKFSKVYPCKRKIILTQEEEMQIDSSAGPIEVLPLWKWLLQEASR